jgi:tetratricopeptide (TPR) repeat protein
MNARLRKASLEALLVDCIRRRAQERPLLLVLEDAHWIDPLSRDLLEAVARAIADVPVCVVVIYRPPDGPGELPVRLARLPYFAELRLAELTPPQAEQLIRLEVAQLFGPRGHFPPALVSRIVERAGGNPFYIDEMVHLVHAQGLDPTDTQALDGIALPESLSSLIMSRLDQLPEGEKTALKVASVVGRVFPAPWLWGSYPQLGSADQVLGYLTALTPTHITPLEQSDGEPVYLFKHVVTQEVAYGSLAVAMQTRLHGQIAAYVERTYAEQIDGWVALLAYHYGRSGDLDKQREYFRRAAEAAQAVYANDVAVAYYERLLGLLPRAEQGPVLLQIGAIWQLIGKWAEAEALYREALADPDSEADLASRTALQHALGDVLHLQGSYAEALEWLEQAEAGWSTLDDPQGISKVLGTIGNVHGRQGNYPHALACAEQQLAIATALDDRRGISRAAGSLGLLYWEQGDYPRALIHCARQLEIAGELGDRQSMGQALSNMANIHWRQGDLAEALTYLEQTLQTATEIGDRRGVGLVVGQIGTVYWSQGIYAQALKWFAQQLQIAAELGDRRGIMIAVGNMGVVYREQHDYDRALACLGYQLKLAAALGDRQYLSIALAQMAGAYGAQGQVAAAERLAAQAIALARALSIPYHLCEYLYLAADLAVRQGRYAEARPWTVEALALARAVQRQDIEFLAEVLYIRLRAASGAVPVASALAELEDLAAHWPDEGEQAALHYEGWRLAPADARRRQAAAEGYRRLYARMRNAEYRRRYGELTGEGLPDPLPLPDLPDLVTRDPVDLAALLAEVDTLVLSAEC